MLNLLAELLIFAGLAIAGYVAWTLWGTGMQTSAAQDDARESLTESWESPSASDGSDGGTSGGDGGSGSGGNGDATGGDAASTVPGEALALIRIPALGADWEWVVLEGTGVDTLRSGIGREPTSARPGEVGNFVLAGHRATYGEPFAHLPDQVDQGDRVEVETREAVHVYQVTRTKHTDPNDVAVMEPVPGQPGVEPSEEWITLITCTPRYGSTGRWIVFGELVETRPK